MNICSYPALRDPSDLKGINDRFGLVFKTACFLLGNRAEFVADSIDTSTGDYEITKPGVYQVTVPDGSNRLQFPDPSLWKGRTISVIISGGGLGDQRASSTFSTVDPNGTVFGVYKDNYTYIFIILLLFIFSLLIFFL